MFTGPFFVNFLTKKVEYEDDEGVEEIEASADDPEMEYEYDDSEVEYEEEPTEEE